MVQLAFQKRIFVFFDKYKYVLLVIVLGLALMLLPTKKADAPIVQSAAQSVQQLSTTEALSAILAQIHGVGRVRVMLTEQSGSRTHYQTDTSGTQDADSTTHDSRTVVISSGGAESGLVTSVSPPVYLGAIVVCQGADDPAVRLAISQAVSSVTGITTDRISVLKMK
jgi:stage III sporulation protein AG